MVSNRIRNVAFVSTYPPRECGLATFTQDLVKELDNINLIKPKIIAVSNSKYSYDRKVVMEVEQHEKSSYLETAKKINNSDIELLVVEHEYGIFGGEWGEYILNLVNNIEIPFITTLHTILRNPSRKQREILRKICEKSDKVITMAHNTVGILKNVYGIEPEKIKVIHHGVPLKVIEPKERLKEKHGFKDYHVVSTFGLISPGKGLEFGINAISEVVKKHSNIVYLILGQTHPCVKNEYGESYRQKLEELAESLGIKKNVIFVNKYLTQDEIIYYLQLTDIYLTPYTNKEQAVSGTLAYAVGYGKVIVSTPYSYAKEMLSEGRGLLAEFNNAHSMAECINYVLDHPEKRKQMEQKTLSLGRTMTWGNVANQYARLFIDTLEEFRRSKAQVV